MDSVGATRQNVCPFGGDCPNAAVVQALEVQLERALSANELLRETHADAISRFTDITTRLAAETAALEEAHEVSEATVGSSRAALENATRAQAQLAARLDSSEAACERHRRDAETLREAVVQLTTRVEELAEALERATTQASISAARVAFLERKEAARAKTASERTGADKDSLPVPEVRPMIDLVAKLEHLRARRAVPGTAAAASPGQSAADVDEQRSREVQNHSERTETLAGAATPLAAPASVSRSPSGGGRHARPHRSGSAESDDIAARLAETDRRAHELAASCRERPELSRLLLRVSDVERRNRELRAVVAAGDDEASADRSAARQLAAAQQHYCEETALRALEQADSWRAVADAAEGSSGAFEPTL